MNICQGSESKIDQYCAECAGRAVDKGKRFVYGNGAIPQNIRLPEGVPLKPPAFHLTQTETGPATLIINFTYLIHYTRLHLIIPHCWLDCAGR